MTVKWLGCRCLPNIETTVPAAHRMYVGYMSFI